MSRTISRVMSRMIICLKGACRHASPAAYLEQTGRLMLRFCLASDGVYICRIRYRTRGSLLHCPSTLTGIS